MSGIEGMFVSDLFNESSTLYDAVIEIGKLGKWIQAIGIVIILWIVFQLINLIIGRKKVKGLNRIRRDLERIESRIERIGSKIDKLGRKRK